MEHENHQVWKPKYDCLLFDLDDTLYPLSSGIAKRCSQNIQEYMTQKLGIEESQVQEMCYVLYKYYGTTMAGLRAIGYDFDYDDYHSFVHGRLPYEFLKPDPVLRNLLLSLPLRKIILTNSDKAHASKVLRRLGLEDCFEEVMCFETLNPTHESNVAHDKGIDRDGVSVTSTASSSQIFDIMEYSSQPDSDVTLPKTPIVCKPFEEAFQQAFKLAEINPNRTLFFDDSVRNLLTAKNVGLHTVLVGNSQRPKGVDYALESIHNIKEAFPELLEEEEKAENVEYSKKIAVEA